MYGVEAKLKQKKFCAKNAWSIAFKLHAKHFVHVCVFVVAASLSVAVMMIMMMNLIVCMCFLLLSLF